MARAIRCRCLAAVALVSCGLLLAPSARAAAFSDDFEADAVGAFPGDGWADVRLVALPSTPLPSALVVATTDASGAPTHALQTVDASAASRGAFRLIAPAPQHALSADVRVDRFGSSGPGATPVTDWPLLFGIASILPGSDLCCFPTPQVGLFVSTLTQGFRLYAIDGAGNASDLDLGVGASVGAWLHLDLAIDAASGSVRSRITDPLLHTMLVDRTDLLPGWTPADFNALTFFGGELGAGDTPGIGSLDNVGYAAVPEPGSFALLALGLAGAAALRRQGYASLCR
jgi:hypothetical protein